VVDQSEKLLGIVTRTDLIKHWARSHPHLARADITITLDQIEAIQGASIARLIARIGELAAEETLPIFMVGGCVRDLLLGRKNLDLDFVVEGDAIAFAKSVHAKIGGRVNSFPPFGTAKWSPDDATLRHLDAASLPDHIDFASARNEFYEHPTALPTVYTGSIKLDLLRRDFTINTLAVQIAPHFGRVIDFYGGLQDLENRLIRVLHSLSFIDDPTRILRAVRFEQRLDFTIEARTAALIEAGLPMLGRITGERVRAELDLLFMEPQPDAGMLHLKSLGALREIHPALDVSEATLALLGTLRTPPADEVDLYPRLPEDIWLVLASAMPPEAVAHLCDRLLISGSLRTLMSQTAELVRRATALGTNKLPSEVVTFLDAYDERAIRTLYATTSLAASQDLVRRYLRGWHHIHPSTTGHTLIAHGLKPGPCFQRILSRLRAGLVNGEFTHQDEMQHVREWLAEGICDDDLP
jgi:tRNA nucleotidyltransferase (CCA-adding enzyme)